MKNLICPKPLRESVAASLVLLAATVSSLAVDDYIVNQFNSAADINKLHRWWGSVTNRLTHDPSNDADNNPASGSLFVEANFNAAAYGGENQWALLEEFSGTAWNSSETIDPRLYTNLVMDIRWEPDSVRRASDFGWFEFALVAKDWSTRIEWGYAVLTNSGWQRVVGVIDPADTRLTNVIAGISFRMWSGASGFTGNSSFWVDNIKLVGRASTNDTPPTVGLQKASPGLHLISTPMGSNPQWNRQNIRTAADSYSWVVNDAVDPQTYSLSIGSMPDKAYSGFQAHLMLVPTNGMVYGPDDASQDWNAANVLFFQVGLNGDGSTTGRFMYKTNQPNGNSMFWNEYATNGPVGTLAAINCPQSTGTWTLTVLDDAWTVTTPLGATTNFAMPAASAALFQNPLFAYVGEQPNNVAAVGQALVVTNVQFSGFGMPAPINDSFESGLSASTWKVAAADSSGVVTAPQGTAYWVTWTLPAQGFNLESASVLDPGAWSISPYATNAVQVRGVKMAPVPSDAAPPSNARFYRMAK
jgi:hypothetical protein